MKKVVKKLKDVAGATLEKQDEQLIRCFVFPFLFKKIFKDSPAAEVEAALQKLFKDSRELSIDFLFLLIEGIEGRYEFPQTIQDNFLDFAEVVEYVIITPIESMDKVPTSLMDQAKSYADGVMKQKLNSLL